MGILLFTEMENMYQNNVICIYFERERETDDRDGFILFENDHLR